MAAYGNSKESEVDRLRNRINLLESELSKLREEVKSLTIKMRSAEIPMEIFVGGGVAIPKPQVPSQIPVAAVQPEPPKNPPVFFLSTPNSDGSFNNSSANSAFREGASIYKFQNTKDNRAQFKIDERDASVKLALNYPDKNIDPVCDALNAFDPRARKIFTEVPGIAELTGDKWRVITKARIRYES
jgi:hypothetical protein